LSEALPGGEKARVSKTIPLIDVVRGIAILYVMAGHSKAALAFPKTPWAQYVWSLFSQNAIYGVSIFFVVSGFLITRLIDQGPGGIHHPDLRWFYARRMGRIIPLWTLTLLVGAVLSFALSGEVSNRFQYCIRRPNQIFDAAFWLSFPTLCFNWLVIARSQVSDMGMHWAVMWSLAVEEQFYILYPWVLRRVTSVGRLAWLLGAVVLAGPLWRWGVCASGSDSFSLSMFASFSGFDQIALGALLYLALRYGRSDLPRGGWGNGVIVLLGLVLVGYSHFGTYTNLYQVDRIYGATCMASGVALCLLGLLNQGVRGAGFLKPLTWPGRYSYGLYLFHSVSLYYLHPYIRPLPTWEAFSIYAVTTTLVAAFSYKYFEMPCNHWIRGWFGEK